MTSGVGHLEIGIDHLYCTRFREIFACAAMASSSCGLARKRAADGVVGTIHAQGPQRAFEQVRLDGA
jgi:hypothetical protein